MRRREFITFLGGAAVTWPVTARAQQPERIRRVDVLMAAAENDPEARLAVAAFQEGLQALGWSDGRNLRIDYRWGGGDADRIRAFAKELIELSPNVVIDHSTPSAKGFAAAGAASLVANAFPA